MDFKSGGTLGLASTTDGKQKRGGQFLGLTAALFYGFMSVASVFLNKAIFEVWKYRFPASLVAGQTVFTVLAITCLFKLRLIKIQRFNWGHMKRVFVVAAVFQVKLVLDMSALVLVNIPMYGILKSTTTPFVMLLDYIIRSKVPSSRVQLAVWVTTIGGFVAGCGDFTFDPLGYALALASALCTGGYVVLVGKVGEELQLDSFTLLLYNSLWSLPLSVVIMVVTGESGSVLSYPHLYKHAFVVAFLCSCASAFVLNYATYLCTQVNDALTTSVVGRTKSVVQGVGGLFAFRVRTGVVNISGLVLNSIGILWYAHEKYVDERRRNNIRQGISSLSATIIHREDSQLTLSPSHRDRMGAQPGGVGGGGGGGGAGSSPSLS